MKGPAPVSLTLGTLRFVGEQDGPPEQVLKAQLSEQFRASGEVQRAYLARIVADGADTVALCLCASRPDGAIAAQVGVVFRSIFGAHEHLDILFLTSAQEFEVQGVCCAFYEA